MQYKNIIAIFAHDAKIVDTKSFNLFVKPQARKTSKRNLSALCVNLLQTKMSSSFIVMRTLKQNSTVSILTFNLFN